MITDREDDDKARRAFDPILNALEEAIKSLRWIAAAVFIIGGGVAGLLAWYLPHLTNEGAQVIAENPNSPAIAVYELFRGAAFAAVATASVVGILHLGRAALDQATRFQKRLMAANFMHYVMVNFEQEIRDQKIELKEIVDVIDVWARNVESAFTTVKFGNSKMQNLRISVDPRGASEIEQSSPRETKNAGAQGPTTT